MWPSTSEKNIPPPPHLRLLVSLSFSTNNVCKNAVFSWRCPFQRKLLFFQTIESAKREFVARAGSRKFLENEKQNSRKNYGAMFSCQVQGHMQKLSSFRGKKKKKKKKKRPKKSLTWFFQAPLQLYLLNPQF